MIYILLAHMVSRGPLTFSLQEQHANPSGNWINSKEHSSHTNNAGGSNSNQRASEPASYLEIYGRSLCKCHTNKLYLGMPLAWVTLMNGPRRTACFTKGLPNYTFSTLNSVWFSYYQNCNRKYYPEVQLEVVSGSATGSSTGRVTGSITGSATEETQTNRLTN